MPCDDSTTCAIDETVNSSIEISSVKPCNENERLNRRKKRRHFQSGESSNAMKNRYNTTPRPTDTTRNSSDVCSPSSSSTSSSSSSASASFSCYDNPRQSDTTNSSSSLILILERPEDHDESRDNDKIMETNDARSSINEKKNHRNIDYRVDRESIERSKTLDGFAEKVTISSIENLAKKKCVTPTARCRRRRSSTSPRNNHDRSIAIDEKVTSVFNSDASLAARSRDYEDEETADFVATSTLMKNGDSTRLSISNNSLLLLRSSAADARFDDTMISIDRDDENVNRDIDRTKRDIVDKNNIVASSRAALTSQQSLISVAAIRGTNVPIGSRNDNNDESTGVESILTTGARYVPPFSFTGSNFNNNNNSNKTKNNNDNDDNDDACKNHGYKTRSASWRTSVVPPLAVVPTRAAPSASSSRQSASSVSKKLAQMLTNSGTKYPCTVGSSPPPYVLSSTRDSSTGFSSAADYENSLKLSSSFTAPKSMRINRPSRVVMSIHASLGRLPTTSPSYTALPVANNAGETGSFENYEISTKPRIGNNEETNFSSATPCSIVSGADGRINSSSQARSSVEGVCNVNGASTGSSSLTKSPLRIVALPPIGNSNNVANAFRNNLAASGCNGNNNNQRCDHLIGACTCSATAATSQTSSTLTRSSNIATSVPTSSWPNNSIEQETDYVVDPVQGNAYHKGQFLGKGGFARVYLMTDVANGNQYACKIIPKNRMQKIHIQKIAREIMIHKELNHVNVVQMHHYFEDNINVYMLLEPCPRKSLMHVLKYRGKVTEPEARYYMRQMVTGVAYIHSQKVVHRDLKPGNMFLSDGMIVKIGDFGLARRPDGQRRRVTICGTPNYIAPEVLYKQAYSYEADVWALGCILYALLAGQPPFDTSTLKETYARICNNRYKKLDDSVASRSGQDLIRWLLQPIPELRPSLERVKEHPYLTMEYVPTKLSHTCCYRVPILHSIVPEQASTIVQGMGNSVNSLTSRGIVRDDNNDRNERNDNATSLTMKNSHRTSNVTSIQANFDANKILNSRKKPKVGNWLFRKLPKLPGFRQRLTKLLCPENKKPDSLMMHRAIESCLTEIRYNRAQENPMLVDRIAPLFVTKWIDYSNKYGLGFQLSDRSVGVLFNDSTKMSYTHDRRRVEYATTEDEVTRYRRENDVPSSMEEKLELLRHFTHYMDNFLTNGGEVREQKATKFSRANSNSVPRMKRWLRTDKAIVMELTVPLLQVNFFVDHSKIVVSEGTRERGYLVTYIDASRQASSYWLNDLRDIGCTADLYERLSYVSKVIGELENDGIFDNPTNLVQHRSKTLRT